MSVLVAGHLCVDLTPALVTQPSMVPGTLTAVGPLSARLGGCVANTARALHALGVPTRLNAILGQDELAELARRLVTREGLDADLPSEPGSTSYSIVIERAGHDRTFWHHAGANDHYDGESVDLSGVELLHLGYPPLLVALVREGGAALVRLLRRASGAGVATSLDLAVLDRDGPAGQADWNELFAAALPLTDIISPSADDLRSLAHLVDPAWGRLDAAGLAADLVARGVAVAMVSDGDEGLAIAAGSSDRLRRAGAVIGDVAEWAGARVAVPPAPIERFRSANGAGDAATAGLLAAVLRGEDPAGAARFAAAVAGRSIEGTLVSAVEQEEIA